MSARSHLVSRDEELGKRDDDFKPRLSRKSSMATMMPWRWRKRRLLLLVILVYGIYCLVYRVPVLVDELNQIAAVSRVDDDDAAAAAYHEPSGAPPRDEVAEFDEVSKHYYNGAISFYKLAQSLRKIPRGYGSIIQSRNILFAASSTKSAANLMPMACEMARIDRNHVHFALFGRSLLSLDDIIMVNGFDRSECRVSFHDARSDFAEFSSDARAMLAVSGAMKHINDFMHPRAMIMDDGAKEDSFFTTAMRAKARDIGAPLIEIPAGRYEEWLWLTRLESNSLANWFEPSIEILIHAPNGSSGGVIRLMKSLVNADYSGLRPPRITLELPPDIEHFLEKYLADFKWPPGHMPLQVGSLILRHRISHSRVNSEQASTRFVESFYPNKKESNHVLVLSPQVELSPLYLQYLHFHILEYRYQNFGWSGAEDLVGISLDKPSLYLDGQPNFTPPVMANLSYVNEEEDNDLDLDAPSPFRYQAASSAASLIFGDKWAVFHDFLSKRSQASHSGKQSKTTKTVSENEPAWVEFLLELMRARGWTMLHPASSLVTVHDDLAQIPEEYARSSADTHKSTETAQQSNALDDDAFVLSAEGPSAIERAESDTTRDLMPLHRMLPFDGKLQEVSRLPSLTHEGSIVPSWTFDEKRDEYVTWFRAAIGGCQGDEAGRERVMQDSKTDDLFCLPSVEMRFEDEDDTRPTGIVDVEEAPTDSTNDALDDSPTTTIATVETTTEQASVANSDDEII